MSKFYFDKNAANDISSGLTNVKNTIDDVKSLITNAVTSIESNDGFNIFEIIEQLRGEIHSLGKLGLYAESGAKTLSEIINLLDNNAKMAVEFTNVIFETGVTAINNVIERSGKEETPIVTVPKWPEGVVVNEHTYEKDGMIYTPMQHWGNEVLVRTDGAGGIGIFKSDGTLYDGYSQNQSWWWNNNADKATVDPAYECTSAALATSSTINGIGKIPDDYNNYGGITQIGGYKYSSEDITRFCVDNLKLGYSTVIYYNYAGYDGFGANGHAVTVVGADPNPTSVYDLWVIDPVDGQSKSFKQAFGDKSDNFYICYECNPNEYGGAGIKSWDIEQYFGN